MNQSSFAGRNGTSPRLLCRSRGEP